MMIHDPSELKQEEFQALLKGAREGRGDALDQLFRSFYPTVETLVHSRLAKDQRSGRPWLHARFSTGDVVQEVFKDLLRDLGAFRGETSRAFCGYLSMVVRNRIVDSVRHHEAAQRDGRRTTSPSADFERADCGLDPEHAAATADEQARFEGFLQSFPEQEQHLLRGRIELDVSFHELAEQLGYSSPSAAKRAFYLAQARLVLFMGKDPDDGARA